MDFPQFQSTLQVGTLPGNNTGASLQSLRGSVDGTYVVVGSPSNRLGTSDAGAFGVFKRTPATLNYTAIGIYQASDRAALNQFGSSLAVTSNADYIVAGAPFATRSGRNSCGSVYLYRKNPTTDFWQVLYQFQASDLLASDYFGQGTAISYSGDYLAVAAPGKNAGAVVDAGQVYLYKKQATTDFWRYLHQVTMSNPVAGSALGTNLQFTWDGSYLMASMSPTVINGSATIVFKKDSTTDYWSEVTRFTGLSTTGFPQFGMSSNGDYVHRPIFYNSSCIFKKQTGTDFWTLQQYIYTPSDIRAGAVAISPSGCNLLVGGPSYPAVAQSYGAAAYFKKSASTDRWDYVSTLRTQSQANDTVRYGSQASFIGDGSFALISAPSQSTLGSGNTAGVVYSYSFSELKQIPASAEYVIANVPQSGRGLYILPRVVSTQSQSLFFRAAPSNVQVQYLRFSSLAGDSIDFQSTISSVGYDTSYQFFNDRASNWYTLASSGTPF